MHDKHDQAGDIATLRTLKLEEDPRTVDEMIAEDSYEVVEVTDVEVGKDGLVFITTDAGFSTGVKGAEPKVGDTVWLYGPPFGHRHGWALNGRVIEWQTPWERFAERITWLADHDRRQREDFARSKRELDAKYDALPAPLKLRIDRFRSESPSFRVESEAYEMAAVGDAPKIARAIAAERGWTLDEDITVSDARVSPDDITAALKTFYDLGYEAQMAVVHDLEPGHSGNTFGAAVSLAGGLLRGDIRRYETERARERNGSPTSEGER